MTTLYATIGPNKSVKGEATRLTIRPPPFHIRLTPAGALSCCVKNGSVRWLIAYGPQGRNHMAASGSQQPPIHVVDGDCQAPRDRSTATTPYKSNAPAADDTTPRTSGWMSRTSLRHQE